MPDLGFYHPIVIHFAIGVLTVGVLFRWTSLTARVAFAGPAGATLILLATLAIVVAAQSGEAAHVAVEAVPHMTGAVRAHQAWGERTRTLALLLAGLELLGLTRRGRPYAPRIAYASAAIGLAAVLSILQTGKLGGELVYAHAAGVGIRSGAPEDVARLLLAGLFEQAEIDERAGRAEEAAGLFELAAQRFPDDPAVQVRAAEARLEDRHDPAGALEILGSRGPTTDDPRLRFRRASLTAEALDATGRPTEARAVLEGLRAAFPDDARVRRRLARADAGPTTN
jgi:uncharacterized membrane protein